MNEKSEDRPGLISDHTFDFKPKCEDCMFWSAFDVQDDNKKIWAECLCEDSDYEGIMMLEDKYCECFKKGAPIDSL